MWEKNLNQKVLLIVGVLALGIWLIYPTKEKLRPGLDIAGGVSLIFEIDDTGLEDYASLAEDMKRLLQKRVDPQGVYDLTWRVLGRNRLEVQMPLPPPGVAELRRAYAEALENLVAANIGRADLENAFALAGEARAPRLAELARGSEQRTELLQKAAQAYEAYAAALEAYRRGAEATQPTTTPTTSTAPAKTRAEIEADLSDAEAALEDAYDAVLATALDPERFREVLEMDERSPIRKNSIDDLTKTHPDLRGEIDRAVSTYAAWRKNRGALDGPADLQRLLRGSGKLEFRILAEPSAENVAKYERYRQQLQERGSLPAAGDEYGWFRVDNPMAFFDLKTTAELTKFDPRSSHYVAEKRGKDYYVLAELDARQGLLADKKNWQLRGARIDRDSRGGYCVDFELDVVGGQLFEDLTRRNINRPLCILVDSVAYSAPNIRSKIRTQGQITGDFSHEKVSYLVQTMQAGSLPARLKETPISERTIGSSLGATNRDMAFRSGLIGVIVVGLFMAGYYLLGGLIANAAMLMNVVLVLAVMAMLQARFTLPGIAGLILTVGMSVDANVLIFERMREEKERGSSVRMIIKNGYDKAFSVILDSNLTTILTSVILYYVGSEEVKGFGLTLGWGIAISMFTALFVTRTIFALLVKYGLLKDITMLKLMGVPKVDWYRLRKIFIPVSLATMALGLVLLVARGSKNTLDVEFLGGVSAELEVKPARAGEPPLDDVKIAERLQGVGAGLLADAGKLSQARVEPVAGSPNEYRLRVPGINADELAAIVTEPLEDQRMLQRGGIERQREEDAVLVRVAGEVRDEQLQALVQGLGPVVRAAGDNIAGASVGSVVESTFGTQKGRFWSVTTTEQNKRLVQYALETALGDRLQRQQRVRYEFRGDQDGRPWPIPGRAQRLESVILDPDFPAGVRVEGLSDFGGGAALYFDKLQPPQSVEAGVPGSIPDRLRNMRLQPGFQDYPFRKFKVYGVQEAGQDEHGGPLYSSVVVAVVDEKYRYSDDAERWFTDFAQKELYLATTALESEQSLRKVSQFKPQIAQRASTQALLAVVLSWLMIIAYMWVRFGRAIYGFAGVVALVHDACIALAFVGIAGWIGGARHPIGSALLIDDFKINMTIVAAILTIIGYSINDTIVIFDRIRELRGRLGRVTPQIINDSVNQCMSRTILTATTVFAVVLVMYVFGGSSIRGFNYCMLVGTLTGCYSTIVIAAPLLLVRVRRRAEPAY